MNEPEHTAEAAATTTKPEAAPKEALSKAREALESIQDLFDQMVPADAIEIVDTYGNTYAVRVHLPARAQIMVVRHLETLTEVNVVWQDMSAPGLLLAIRSIVKAAEDPKVLGAISEAFAIANPKAAKAALAAAVQNGDPAEDAADVFGVEEMVRALIPFVLTAVTRGLRTVTELLSQRAR